MTRVRASSYRRNRRLRTSILSALVVFTVTFGLGVWRPSGQARAASNPQAVVAGVVESVSANGVRLAVNGRTFTVTVLPSTQYIIDTVTGKGSARQASYRTTSKGSLHRGTQVLVVVQRSGKSVVATEFHELVKAGGRTAFSGRIVWRGGSSLGVSVNGHTYTVVLAPQTLVAVNGVRTSFASLRNGDTIVIVGLVTGKTVAADGLGAYRATRTSPAIKAPTPPKKPVPTATPTPRNVFLHGTITVNGSSLVFTSSAGQRYPVTLGRGYQVNVSGKPASLTTLLLMSGSPMTVKGTLVGNHLVAATLNVSPTVNVITGRVTAVTPAQLTLHLVDQTTEYVQMPPGVLLIGSIGTNHTIPVGAMVQLAGITLGPHNFRALSGRIVHPSLNTDAVVTAVSPSLVVRVAGNQKFQVQFSNTTQVSLQGAQTQVTTSDVPVGARLHIQGVIQTDGSLAADRLIVQLQQTNTAGKVVSLRNGELKVTTSAGSQQVRLAVNTVIQEGKHTLSDTDLVQGDQVSVVGYRARNAVILAKSVLVHRANVTLKGTVAKITNEGFVLKASDGDHRVVLGGAPGSHTITVPTLSSGAGVTVTGEVRGDGVILAWTVALDS